MSEKTHHNRKRNLSENTPADDNTDPDSPKVYTVHIVDKNSSDGKIYNRNPALEALTKTMYKDLMTDSEIRPQFECINTLDQTIKVMTYDLQSVEYLMDLVNRLPPPWRGAQLEATTDAPLKMITVEALVPGQMISVSKLLEIIHGYDPMINSMKWQRLGSRPHAGGNVFTFGIDRNSFNQLNKHDGFLPYMDTRMEFRVLESNS